MPSRKEIQARQNRQRERIAAAHAERRRTQRLQRTIGAVAGGIVVIVAIVLALVLPNRGGGSVAVSPTTTAPSTTVTTTAPSTTVVQKTCVGLKDTLPEGAPAMPVPVGPSPKTLVTRDLKAGTGAVVPQNGKVTVNYVGVACTTGKIFDSSYAHNQTFDANLSGGVIQGWMQGIPGMKVGGVRLLEIPPNLAYGAEGSPPTIGPNEPLFFLVEAVKLG